jgi:Domain of Unknown Function (DUF1080)
MLALSGLLAGCATETRAPAPRTDAARNQSVVAPDEPTTPATSVDPKLAAAAAKPPASFQGEGWQQLCDGRSLRGWKITGFGGHGEVHVESGLIVLGTGDALTGIQWTNDVPKMDYEVALDAMRVEGSDFFCGLTFPVGDSFCSLILGGWGGAVVGLSSIDGNDASENETSQYIGFASGRWYRVRLRVTRTRIEAWLDGKEIVDLVTTGRKISLRYGEIELSKPFGLATWQTTGALREIRLRRLNAADNPGK